MADYDITEAFKRIEDELIASMIRNMDRHRAEEMKEGLNWTMWQAEQLKALEKYKRENREKYSKEFTSINSQVKGLLQQARDTGSMEQEISILNAIKKGYQPKGNESRLTGQFFRLNDRKLDTLIQATTRDMKKAETAVLRKANDEYRKAIFNAQVYANSGAGTYEQAVDMATKDMLSRGLACVEYKNGTRHSLEDYADMAIRTANKRAYLQGEGKKRQEWGISTVIMNKRGNPCPLCLPWVGKVLIDDVWSDGSEKEGNYPLMSEAVAAGLYHPRCQDSHSTYFPGVSTADDTWTKEELEAVEAASKKKARQQYATRQAEKFERLSKYSLDEGSREKYCRKAGEWRGETPDNHYLKLPDDITTVKGMTEDRRIEIEKAIEMLQKKYKIDLGEISVEPCTGKERKSIFITGPYEDGGKLKIGLVINSNVDYSKIEQRLILHNQTGYYASKTVGDMVKHEIAHVMTFQDCKTIQEYRRKKVQVDRQFIKGISGYGDSCGLGSESLAEAFVRIQNGEKVPLGARLLVRQYIERWKH